MLFCFFRARTGEILKERVPRLRCGGIGFGCVGGVEGVAFMNGERLKSALIFGVRFEGVTGREAGERTSTLYPFVFVPAGSPAPGGVLLKKSVRWVADGSMAGSEMERPCIVGRRKGRVPRSVSVSRRSSSSST